MTFSLGTAGGQQENSAPTSSGDDGAEAHNSERIFKSLLAQVRPEQMAQVSRDLQAIAEKSRLGLASHE